ncbi:MAG TPA: hypothetical protein VJ011_02920 [Steroidobacteraceae bacterium]|nr:hypothetical protein [Steroidobacteraceae bacterium]
MGGAWVFPGGKVESADFSARALARCRDVADRELEALAETSGRMLSREMALGLYVAACRETFEETGVLLARYANGEPCDGRTAARLRSRRGAVCRDASLFTQLLEEQDLVIEPACFVYWAHWITPSAAPQRFDARFFAVSMPADQLAQCDSAETSELSWLDLRSFGELPAESFISAPPTRFSLADVAARLREHGNLERTLTLERHRCVPPIVPKMTQIDGKATAVLPWDASYASLPGEGTPSQLAMPERYLDLPSRVIARHEIRAPRHTPAP